jgi:hypothetical protein
MKIEINKKQKTIKIIPKFVFLEFKVYRFTNYFHLDFVLEKTDEKITHLSGRALFFKDFGGRKHYPTSINVENITETEINLTYE